MEKIIETLTRTENIAFLVVCVGIYFVFQEYLNVKNEVKELRKEIVILRDKSEKTALELGELRGKTELAESIGKKLDKIEMFLATKNNPS